MLFLTEMVVGVIVPLVLLGTRKVRESAAGLVAGSACVLLGLALNRLNVTFLALDAPAEAAYFPNWMEILVALAVIASGVLLFALAVRFLSVLPAGERRPAFLKSPT